MIWLAWLALSLAQASSVDALLQRGTVISVERSPSGALTQVTVMALVSASPEQIWAQISDFASYPEWMPGVHQTRVHDEPDEPQVVVDWVLAVPGPNVRYTGRYQLDREHWTLSGEAISENLGGSAWTWTLEPVGAQTRVIRTARSQSISDNWLLDMLGEHKSLLDLGINLASPVTEVEAVKARCGGS